MRFSHRPSPVVVCALAYGLMYLLTVAHFYPRRVDAPETIHFQPTPEQQRFYNAAFDPRQARYEEIAREKAQQAHIKERLQAFVRKHNLARAHVLEIGSGEGTLQDIVDDYTGLDISATVRPNYHKRFVQADARALPFGDNEFDAIWTVWVLEHVPNPEQALSEIRRVLKPNGLLFLSPAWLCSDLAANGYVVRPYSDFDWRGKLTKATAPLQYSPVFRAAYLLPIRASRLAAAALASGPTAFHYRPLVPNYNDYWVVDGDAVNSLDMFEAYLWFRSRGDQCMNCPSTGQLIRTPYLPLEIRVKPAA